MSNCLKCGNKIGEVKFCGNCGNPTNKISQLKSNKNSKPLNLKKSINSEVNIRVTPKYSSFHRDKFKDRIDLNVQGSLNIYSYNLNRKLEKGGSLSLQLRYSKIEDKDGLVVIDYKYNGLSWIHIKDYDLIINLDSIKNIKSKAISTDSSVGKNAVGELNEAFGNVLGHKTRSFLHNNTEIEVNEVGYYIFTMGEFLEICKSEKIEFQINSQKQIFESDLINGKNLHILFKSLYSDLYTSDEFDKYLEINKISNPTPNSGCFIATATMGDYNNPIVKDLRLFRDMWLLKRTWGKDFVEFYYRYSPSLAITIQNSNILKKIIRNTMIRPLHMIIGVFFKY